MNKTFTIETYRCIKKKKLSTRNGDWSTINPGCVYEIYPYDYRSGSTDIVIDGKFSNDHNSETIRLPGHWLSILRSDYLVLIEHDNLHLRLLAEQIVKQKPTQKLGNL